jgi:short-subunit dehydrogenase
VLRLEQRRNGVTVGTAHPIWIDTDLVRDFRDDLATFRAALKKLPWPLSQVISVEDCARSIVKGIEARRRKVYVPRNLGIVQAMRPIVLSAFSDAVTVRGGGTHMVAEMEDEVRKLGRSFGKHSQGGAR